MSTRHNKIKILPIFVLGEFPEITARSKTPKYITKSSEKQEWINKMMQKFTKSLVDKAKFAKPIIVESEKVRIPKIPFDLFLVQKLCLGYDSIIRKLSLYRKPIILYAERGGLWLALDSREHLKDNTIVFTCLGIRELEKQIKAYRLAQKIKNLLKDLKILLFVPNVRIYHKFLDSRFPFANIKRFGAILQFINKAEMLKEYRKISGARLTQRWLRMSKSLEGTTIENIKNVAKLYLTIKKFLKKKNARALAISCSEKMAPLRSPCFALSTLRDEGIPAACEVDISSVITMFLMTSISKKPQFMGNVLDVSIVDNTITVSHCSMPLLMTGTSRMSFSFRNYHGESFLGSLTAFVPLPIGEEVTWARLNRNASKIVIGRGKILDHLEISGWCRNTLILKISDAQKFLKSMPGNHLVIGFGNMVASLAAILPYFNVDVMLI